MVTETKEQAEELLETLWIRTEEGKESYIPLDGLGEDDRATAERLAKSNSVTINDNRITLTVKGRIQARSVVRRHRLAERLLADVLGTGDNLMHERACKFEHLLDRGLDESICTLLGHPKICPHGKPIPPGRCCLQDKEKEQPHRVVSPLSQLSQGKKGKVAYIYAPESSQLQKLMAMGILPGASISLIQSFPSYVFQAEQSQFAVDKAIADSIYVRLVEEEAPEPAEVKPSEKGKRERRRWRFGR